MTRPLKPPRGIFVGTSVLFHSDLTPAVRDTLLQLMALAWSSACHQTPPVTIAMLEHLTGKSARTLRAHLALLRSEPDVLRLQPAGKGHFYVTLAGWLFGGASAGEKGENRPRGGNPLPGGKTTGKDGEDSPPESGSPARRGKNPPGGGDLPCVKDEEDDRQNQALPGSNLLLSKTDRRKAAAPGSPGGRPPERLPAGLEAALREVGLFPSLLPEVAGLAQRDGYSEDDLRALLAWCQEDEPRRPAALFVGRLRAGARAPAEYNRPACPRCGRRAGHSPECSRRFALDGTG
jgi:hypothetical protein